MSSLRKRKKVSENVKKGIDNSYLRGTINSRRTQKSELIGEARPMKKITKKDIKQMQKELEKAEGKRAIFLMATINRYSRMLGLDIEYRSWEQ